MCGTGAGAWLYGLLRAVAGLLLSFFAFFGFCFRQFGGGGERERRNNRRAFATGAVVGLLQSAAASLAHWRWGLLAAGCTRAGGQVFCV